MIDSEEPPVYLFPMWLSMMNLTFEVQLVIWLRMVRLSQGGLAAKAEASRMVAEKIAAAEGATLALLSGASPKRVTGSYRRRVRANIKRLSNPSRKGR